MTEPREPHPTHIIDALFFSDNVKQAISEAIDVVDRVELGYDGAEPDPTVIVMTWDRLRSILTPAQFEVTDQLMSIDPLSYGFKGERFDTVDQPPEAFVQVAPQPYKSVKRLMKDGAETIEIVDRMTTTQFVPLEAWGAIERMNNAMTEEIGKQVIVESGYRSPAYQMMVFLTLLRDVYDYDIAQTAQHVALPYYSEHGSFDSPATDFQSIDPLPIPGDTESFEQTPEFAWLMQRAGDFGLTLSYPRGNDKGVMYEPWHWRMEP